MNYNSKPITSLGASNLIIFYVCFFFLTNILYQIKKLILLLKKKVTGISIDSNLLLVKVKLTTRIKQNYMKEYFCVGSYLPFDTINRSQLNTSTAKHTFSFSRSKRFSDYKPNCNVVAYGTNEFKLRREGPVIGSSQRQAMFMPNENPSPAKYRVRTEPSEQDFAFGMSRQNVKAYDYLNIESAKFPSSTKYEVISHFKKLYKNAPIYTMKKRNPPQKLEQVSPGPAMYNLAANKSKNLELTKYKSISFSTGKSRRFQNSETQAPGPGAYREANESEQRFRGGANSRHHSSLGTKFTHARRKTFIDDEMRENAPLPGPGNYKSTSQFGQYDGDIYKTFETSGKRTSDFIYYNDSRPRTTQKSKRPLTSKP